MKESSVERKLVEGCRKAGAMAWKFTSPGRSGVPDRIVLLPGGRLIFVELKTSTGRVTPLQLATHNLLRGYGFDVRVLHGAEEVGKFLTEVKRRCKGGKSIESRSDLSDLRKRIPTIREPGKETELL